VVKEFHKLEDFMAFIDGDIEFDPKEWAEYPAYKNGSKICLDEVVSLLPD
jgi:hypothetical protein